MTLTEPGALPPSHDLAPGWGYSLSTGAPGIALLHIEHAHAGLGSWRTVHQWAAAVTREPVTANPETCGLYRGAPAVAFALRAAAQPAYASALRALDDHIAASTRQRLARAHERIERGHFPALREFDLVSGLTGIGVYLLRQGDDRELLVDLLAYLVRLTEPLRVDGNTAPGWWTANGPQDRPSSRWPGGHGNLGIAHGIAGPLALLAITMRRGVAADGQGAAITRICAWLDQWRRGPTLRAWWPGILTPAGCDGDAHPAGPQRPSWCYGTPGIARAQQLAGLALADRTRQRGAEAALVSCIVDETQLAQVGGTSLCHGWAGLLQATWRAALDAGPGSELGGYIPQLRARMEQHVGQRRRPDHAGMLEGQAGVDLARHSTVTDAPPASGWDACLLLDS